MPSAPPSLLSAAGAGQASRAASCAIAKPTRGFHVFRIDGYTWTKALPGGERITSQRFTVGNRFYWHIDYYPNGTNGSSDDDGDGGSIALYLRLHNTYKVERVQAQYKFSLLDLAGDAAYELPAETGVFRSTAGGEDDPGCGYAEFIAKVELERRRDSLLREDCLAVRCDVGVTEVVGMEVDVATNRHGRGRLRPRYRSPSLSSSSSDDDDDVPLSSRRRGQQQPPDEQEYIRRCLAAKRSRRR